MSIRPTFDPLRTLLAELAPRRIGGPASWPQPVLCREPEPSRRTKLWELGATLHCSIIGTCLSTAELRRALEKANLRELGSTEHELHGQGVTLAGKPGQPAKLLHKALDERHRLAIKRFDKADTEEDVRALWQEARRQGDIPGGYWAVLTHPASPAGLIREVFGEVHMLSHLVGAANRADIKRLSALEEEKDSLAAKIERQQSQLARAIGERDRRIAELTRLLASRTPADAAAPTEEGESALAGLVAELQRRLEREQARRIAADEKLAKAQAALAEEAGRRESVERLAASLGDEIEALERSLATGDAADDPACDDLDELSLLYVGGRPSLVPQLRAASRRLGASLSHHDGGIEERQGLLVGLVSRADLVLFPVDCVSHDAAIAVKRLCRQAGKPFVALRSGGLASFVAALSRHRPAVISSRAAVS